MEGKRREAIAMIPRALTVAGSDSGGGAGIQADLKTFQELGVFGMTALTAVTAQNTLGVSGVWPLPPEAVVKQIEAVATDIGVDAAKTGMLFDSAIIEAVAEAVRRFAIDKLVVDPVMVARGGAPLLKEDAIETLRRRLLPHALLVTPNIPEAEVLTGMTIRTRADMEKAARAIVAMGAKAVVVKGGHSDGETADDLFYDRTRVEVLSAPRVATRNTHGTGCTFSAAVTAALAKGEDLLSAVRTGKAFITAAIREALDIGGGHGPTNHWAYRAQRDS
jgi:phosphomethylpyrimidine kinase